MALKAYRGERSDSHPDRDARGLHQDAHDAYQDALGPDQDAHDPHLDALGPNQKEHDAYLDALGVYPEAHDAYCNRSVEATKVRWGDRVAHL